MPDTETEHHHHRGVAAVAGQDLVASPSAPPATSSSSSSCDTATARDEDEVDGFTFAAAAAVAIPCLQDADDCAYVPDARIGSPVYPVFGRPRRSLSLPKQQQQEDSAGGGTATVRRVTLGRLLLVDRWCDSAPSASGQQLQPADAAAAELDGVPAETYCLWSPGISPPASAGSPRRASLARCRKSGSTGSSVLGTSSDSIDAGEGQGWMNRGSPARGGGKSSSTAFLQCKQDLVELVASLVTCRRRCYLF